MQGKIPAQALVVASLMQDFFENSLLAVYLYGSAVIGGLRPKSDVDLLVIINQPMTDAVRSKLTIELMRISGRHPAVSDELRPLELIIFLHNDISEYSYPLRSEYVYGEWLRDSFEAGVIPEPVSDPDFTLLLAQARQEARPLIGLPPMELLPCIPDGEIRRAMGDAIPSLLNTLVGDEGNVLLTLVRMLQTVTTGEFVPKNIAAEWAIPRLPSSVATVVFMASQAYLGQIRVDWSNHAQVAQRAADILAEKIKQIL